MISKKTLSANLYAAFAVMGLAVSSVNAYAAGGGRGKTRRVSR